MKASALGKARTRTRTAACAIATTGGAQVPRNRQRLTKCDCHSNEMLQSNEKETLDTYHNLHESYRCKVECKKTSKCTYSMILFIGSSRTDKSKLRNQNSGCVVPWQGVRGGRVQGIEKHGIF